jgi:hypothetical protein
MTPLLVTMAIRVYRAKEMRNFKGRIVFISIMASMGLMAQAFGQTCDQNYDASLTRAFANTVSAVRSNDAYGFLALVSPDGLTIGADGANIPYTSLKTQFVGKSGAYCDIFACNGRIGIVGRAITLIGAQRQIDTRHATALVIVGANTDNELLFSYKFFTSCRWELNAIGYQ